MGRFFEKAFLVKRGISSIAGTEGVMDQRADPLRRIRYCQQSVIA